MLRFPSQPACWLVLEGFCLAPVRLDLECSQSNLASIKDSAWPDAWLGIVLLQ